MSESVRKLLEGEGTLRRVPESVRWGRWQTTGRGCGKERRPSHQSNICTNTENHDGFTTSKIRTTANGKEVLRYSGAQKLTDKETHMSFAPQCELILWEMLFTMWILAHEGNL